jgi:uncharacterized Fe-S center protein
MKIGQSLEGKGKYDEQCEAAFRACEAQAVVLIVINGNKGHGFSAIAPADINQKMPELLRITAEEIEKQQKQATTN